MNGKLVGIGLVCALVISVILIIIFVNPVDVSPPEKEDSFKNWNRSGPFAIDKTEYIIGNNVFIAVDGLTQNDAGNIVFVLPNGTTKYISIPFDGTQKSGFNQYFKPSLSKGRGICSTDDLIGEWTIVFQGTNYESIKFTIRNETIPSEIGIFSRVC